MVMIQSQRPRLEYMARRRTEQYCSRRISMSFNVFINRLMTSQACYGSVKVRDPGIGTVHMAVGYLPISRRLPFAQPTTHAHALRLLAPSGRSSKAALGTVLRSAARTTATTSS
jgi:hypothetical protein